jgi:nucleotide-binding universal stress UspA family protein
MGQGAHPYVIIVATDFSEAGDRAFDHALALTQQPPDSLKALGLSVGFDKAFSHTDLHVVWVDSGYDPMGQMELAWQSDKSLVRDAIAKMKEYVKQRAAHAGMGKLDLDRVVCHARVGDASQHIVQLATDLRAELVVLGTHGRTGIKRWLLGSVAERVARLAPCPVLIVRKLEHDTAPVEEKVEPACAECERRRDETAGEELWCKEHD